MKILILSVVIFVSQVLTAQDLQNIYSNISNQCGADIIKNFKNKESDVKSIANVMNVKIAILPFLNENNEITQISLDLTPKIASVMQQSPKPTLSNFDNIQFYYVDDLNTAGSCNLVMTASYYISNEQFVIDKINLKNPNGNGQVSLPQSSANVPTTQLKKANYAAIATDIEQLSRSIVSQFGNLIGLKDVSLDNFLGSTNQLPSQFSELLMEQLENDFVSLTNISVKRNISDKRNMSRSINSTVRYIVSGTYTTQGDKIKIIATLKDPSSGVTEGSAIAYIKKSYLTNNNIAIEPVNTSKIRQDNTILQQTSIDDDFSIDIWTNKGNNRPVFRQGEEMKLYIQANESCYVRLYDIMPDGRIALIIDNYHIAQTNVGQAIFLGGSTCVPPFGAETIVIMAQDQEFADLNLQTNSDGLSIITDGLQKSRSFTSITPQSSNTKKAEKYIYVTSIK